MTQLYNYILEEKTPLHLYYSSAYYDNPANENMELKGWLGSDLLFDIDADSFPNCDKYYTICILSNSIYDGRTDCPKNEEPIHYLAITADCIERALNDVKKLYDILRDELGFRDIRVYFSGNKGFHIKVLDEKVHDLTRDERRELVAYITGEGIDIEHLAPTSIPGKKARRKYVLFFEKEFGVRKRLLKLVKEYGLEVVSESGYIKVAYEDLMRIINDLRINIDAVVTIDTSRLSRFGFSLNGKSGLVVKPLDINTLTHIDWSMFNPWEGVFIIKSLVDADLIVFDNKYKLRRGEAMRLDAAAALHLAFKKLVHIIDVVDFGVRNVRSLS